MKSSDLSLDLNEPRLPAVLSDSWVHSRSSNREGTGSKWIRSRGLT